MANRFVELMQNKRTTRIVLLLSLWVPAIILLLVVREVLVPFLLAVVFAYVLAPLVRRLSTLNWRGRQLPRWAAVVIVYLALGTVMYSFGSVVIPQIYEELKSLVTEASTFMNDLDDAKIAEYGQALERFFTARNVPIDIVTPGDVGDESHGIRINFVELAQTTIRDIKAAVGQAARAAALTSAKAVIAGVVGVIFKTFLVLMLTAFIAADTNRIVEFFFSIIPVSDRTKLRALLDRIDRGLSAVIRGQLAICAINGTLTFIGLWLLKVKFAFLLASVAAVFSLVPIFGTILSTVAIVIVALPANGIKVAVLAVLWIIGIHFLEHFLNAKIQGAAAKTHPVLIVLALIVGERYYGLVGALLAVPMMSVVATVFRAARTRAMALDSAIAAQDEAALAAAAPATGTEPPLRPRVRVTREHPSS